VNLESLEEFAVLRVDETDDIGEGAVSYRGVDIDVSGQTLVQ
jgi:hypothetical protein